MNLVRVELNFQKAFDFCFDNFKGTNKLSDSMLLHLKNGNFFTFLPKEVSSPTIHNFSESGIAKGVMCNIQELLRRLIKKEQDWNFLIDAVDFAYQPNSKNILLQLFGRRYQDQTYFYVDGSKVAFKEVLKCLDQSFSFWHSLCAISKAKLESDLDEELLGKEIEDFCNQVEMILALAYDGEGYIFWEKNKSKKAKASNL